MYTLEQLQKDLLNNEREWREVNSEIELLLYKKT